MPQTARCLRRHLVAATTLLAMFGITSCGTDSDTHTETDAAANSTSAPVELGKLDPSLCDGKHYTIGFDTFSDTEAFAVNVLKGLKDSASELGCVEIVTLVDNADPATAVSNVRSLVQQDVDGVILFQVIAAANEGIAKILEAAGRPAVSISAAAPGIPFIFPDEAAAGALAGTELAKATSAEFGADADPYLIVGGFPEGGDGVVARTDGIVSGATAVFPELGGDHVIEVDTKADPPTANARTLDALANVPAGAPIMLSGISDSTTNAMYQAVVRDGREDDATVVAIGGAAPSGLQFVCDNEAYAGVVAYQPEIDATFMLTAVLAERRGQDVPDVVNTPVAYLTRDNMKQTYADAPC
jgi:ABC-type sugar transport system substrate-binding protein